MSTEDTPNRNARRRNIVVAIAVVVVGCVSVFLALEDERPQAPRPLAPYVKDSGATPLGPFVRWVDDRRVLFRRFEGVDDEGGNHGRLAFWDTVSGEITPHPKSPLGRSLDCFDIATGITGTEYETASLATDDASLSIFYDTGSTYEEWAQ